MIREDEGTEVRWIGIKNEEAGEYETLYGKDPYLRYDPDGLAYDRDLFDIYKNL